MLFLRVARPFLSPMRGGLAQRAANPGVLSAAVTFNIMKRAFTLPVSPPKMLSRVCLTQTSTRTTFRAASTAQPAVASKGGDIYQKDYYHLSSIGLVTLIPVALLLSPSAWNFPVDIALGFLLPFHGHLGMQLVLSDYVYGKRWAHILLWLVTVLAALGLLRLNLSGPGISESVKLLWTRQLPAESAAKAH